MYDMLIACKELHYSDPDSQLFHKTKQPHQMTIYSNMYLKLWTKTRYLRTNLLSKLWLREAAVTRIATISNHYSHLLLPLPAPNIPINVSPNLFPLTFP